MERSIRGREMLKGVRCDCQIGTSRCMPGPNDVEHVRVHTEVLHYLHGNNSHLRIALVTYVYSQNVGIEVISDWPVSETAERRGRVGPGGRYSENQPITNRIPAGGR